MKTCSSCRRELPESSFYVTKIGCKLSSCCKPCSRNKAKLYYQKNRTELLERSCARSKIWWDSLTVGEKREIGRRNFALPTSRFYSYRHTAKKRGIGFNITFEQFMTFWNKPCFYCGVEIKTIGLDRKDSTEGYELNNVIPCCSTCNYAKRDMSMEQYIEHCRAVVEHSLAQAGGYNESKFS